MMIPGEPKEWQVLQFHIHTGTDHAMNGEYYGADLHVVHTEVGGDRYGVLGFFLEPTSSSDEPMIGSLLEMWEDVESSVMDQCQGDGFLGDSPVVSAGRGGGGGRGGGDDDDDDDDDSLVESESAGREPGRGKGEGPKSGDDDAYDIVVESRGVGGTDDDDGSRRLSKSFNMYGIIPAGSSIYTYAGSLTTPPCSEVVFWNVIDTPVKLSVREYLRLSNLLLDYVDAETCEFASMAAPSGFTGRPVQGINGREITRRCPSSLASN
jgi:carbonic anhydrase